MRKLALAVLLGGCALLGGCGSPALLQCRAEAVKFLPSDPGQVTPYDVKDLVERLHACEPPAMAAVPAGDAGAR